MWEISLTVTSAEGCVQTFELPEPIHVLPSPIADFTTLQDVSGEIPLAEATISFINQSQYANSYFWEFGDGFVSVDVDPIHSYESEGVYPVWLYAYNEFGCVDSTVLEFIRIIREGTLFIPNAFTPNGDGRNDFFQIKGARLDNFSLLIFNRWGDEVYRSNNINQSWNGIYHGKPAPEGAYVWKIEAGLNTGVKIQRGGSLTLLR